MAIKMALAGNPNSGKTTLFNALTGAGQYTGNWPGVTVEKKEGKWKARKDVTIVDLPGIYSLSPYTLEEVITRNYLLSERPDVILNIIDGTNLERNLYLTTQILELGIPVLVAVNRMDLVEKSKDRIQMDQLGELLGCEAVPISAQKGTGVLEAAEKAVALAQKQTAFALPYAFDERVERAIASVGERLGSDIPAERKRFFAIKLLERDDKIAEQIQTLPDVSDAIEALERTFDDDAESIITNERYACIASVLKSCYVKNETNRLTVSDKIDRIVTNRLLALPIFAAVMFLVYYVSVTTVGGWATDWVNDGLFGEGFHFFGYEVPGIPVIAERALQAVRCADWMQGLVIDGIIAGVGAVLGFVPQMLTLFACLGFLEACGYMARIAFIMDRIFRRFGLSGKSFIPMLIGTGCSVPGIMASRTIEQDRDRKMTIMTTTFIPCGAKLPVIAMIAGAFFDNSGWVACSAFFVGIAAVVCSGILLKKTKAFAGEAAPFVMELPAYHMPTAGALLQSMWERGFSFIKKAGTVILLSAVALWFLQGFGWVDGGFALLEEGQAEYSVLAAIGGILGPLFAPLGWGDWNMAVAALTGLIAKENVVATFGVLSGYAEVAENGVEIWSVLAAGMTAAAAYSFLVFNLLCAPCFAAMGAIRREMNNRNWFWFAIGYQTALAYAASFCVYQFGTFAATGTFGGGTAAAILVTAAVLYLLFRPDLELKRVYGKKKLGINI